MCHVDLDNGLQLIKSSGKEGGDDIMMMDNYENLPTFQETYDQMNFNLELQIDDNSLDLRRR